MSHYIAAVFSRTPDDVARLLAPYQETETNDKSKWDWYIIGGTRFKMLRLKAGGTSAQARVSEFDFSRDEQRYESALRRWDEMRERRGEQSVRAFEEMFGSREHCAEIAGRFVPFAFVDADGGWHQESEKGWFGIANTTKTSLDVYLDELDAYMKVALAENLWLTICDCHI